MNGSAGREQFRPAIKENPESRRPQSQFFDEIFESLRQMAGGFPGLISLVHKAVELTGVKIGRAVEFHLPIRVGKGIERFCEFVGCAF